MKKVSLPSHSRKDTAEEAEIIKRKRIANFTCKRQDNVPRPLRAGGGAWGRERARLAGWGTGAGLAGEGWG